jgi:hypothetical protein
VGALEQERDELTEELSVLQARVEQLDAMLDQLRTLHPAPPTPAPQASAAVPVRPARVKPTPKPNPGAVGSKYDLAEVAELAREAAEKRVSPAAFVFEHLDGCPSATMANWLISRARKAGHDIPRRRTASTPDRAGLGPVPPLYRQPVARRAAVGSFRSFARRRPRWPISNATRGCRD